MSPSLAFPDAVAAEAWEAYLARERGGSRGQLKGALDRFVALMLKAAEADRDAFVGSWCRAYLDGNETWPVHVSNGMWMRQPLFAVFAEPLERGRRDGRAECFRWSAELHGHFRVLGGWDYQPGEQAMLLAGLAIDPSDNRARMRLIERRLSEIDFCCHELPRGLLWYPEVLLAAVDRLEPLFEGTVWSRDAMQGIAALRRIAHGDWSDPVVASANSLLRLRYRIAHALFPKSVSM